MKDFLAWNNAVAAHFFRPEYRGRTVYLYVTNDVLEAVGGNGNVPEFIAAMKAGPAWATRSGICQKALQSMEGWRSKDFTYPPYVGYLALFVLAAGHGDFPVQAYYPRLRDLLGEIPESGTYPSFGKMLELWSDLEHWLNIERAGELGILRTDIAGSWLHVGLPIAQAVLIETERQHLHLIFADIGLDPEFPPTDLELARIVHSHGSGALRTRTMRALEDSRSEYGSVLVDRILEELESWDGTIPDTGELPGSSTSRYGTAILCLQVDEVSHRANAELRCRYPEPFPDPLVIEAGGMEYSAREGAAGYSTPFVDASHIRLNPSALDWSKGMLLRSATETSAVRWSGASLRVFADGKDRGLPGFVEVQAFDPSRRFLIATAEKLSQHVTEWGSSSCANFRRLNVDGLPAGWTLFAGDGATDDALIRDHAPRLSFSAHLRRIRVSGGIHVPGRQSYFRFAPPTIRLDGGAGYATITINDASVPRDDDGSFAIPDEFLSSSILVVAAGTLKRVIYLEDGTAGEPLWTRRVYGPDGTVLAEDAAETLPCGVPATAEASAVDGLATRAVLPGIRATLIGPSPGDIAECGQPLDFAPVWMILQRGREYCSSEYIAGQIVPPAPARSRNTRSVRAWKEVLWHHRKRVTAPSFDPLRRLWLAYQKAAEHV